MDLNGVNDHTWVHDQKFLFSTRSSWSTCIQEGVVLLRSRSSRNILGSCSIFQVCSCLMTLVGNSSKKIWEIEVWMFFSSGYGSLPINTIFSGMNIHLPAILGFTRGTGFLTHPQVKLETVSCNLPPFQSPRKSSRISPGPKKTASMRIETGDFPAMFDTRCTEYPHYSIIYPLVN